MGTDDLLEINRYFYLVLFILRDMVYDHDNGRNLPESLCKHSCTEFCVHDKNCYYKCDNSILAKWKERFGFVSPDGWSNATNTDWHAGDDCPMCFEPFSEAGYVFNNDVCKHRLCINCGIQYMMNYDQHYGSNSVRIH